jgi:acetolactate synthase-1/2/3 large subunit
MVFSLSKGDWRIQGSLSFRGNLPSGILANREGTGFIRRTAQARHQNFDERSVSMNGAGLLVAALENEGVKQIFGVPGEENLDVVEALRRSTIRLVVTRHEQAAAFMAATHGRLTGEAGVCLSTLGPGALNLTTGAAYALLGAMPMIMITGQKGILSRKQARFQVVDIVSTMTPLTKMARQIMP